MIRHIQTFADGRHKSCICTEEYAFLVLGWQTEHPVHRPQYTTVCLPCTPTTDQAPCTSTTIHKSAECIQSRALTHLTLVMCDSLAFDSLQQFLLDFAALCKQHTISDRLLQLQQKSNPGWKNTTLTTHTAITAMLTFKNISLSNNSVQSWYYDSQLTWSPCQSVDILQSLWCNSRCPQGLYTSQTHTVVRSLQMMSPVSMWFSL